jgi:hypothetical protein
VHAVKKTAFVFFSLGVQSLYRRHASVNRKKVDIKQGFQFFSLFIEQLQYPVKVNY